MGAVRCIEAVRIEAKSRWGFDLKEHQEQAICSALRGDDVVVTLATGGGKSLCYQAFAMCSADPVLVVSPLVSLMQDQVNALRLRGIRACNMSDEAFDAEARIVYASPEKCVTQQFHKRPWALIAVDEAHCVVDWGNDFRPEYGQLGSLFRPVLSSPFRASEELRDPAEPTEPTEPTAVVPIMALTASATPDMVQKIVESLRLRKDVLHRVCGTVVRPNLIFRVMAKKSVGNPLMGKYHDIRALIHPPCIVYATTRKESEAIAEELLNFRCAPYHAGMDDEQRREVLELFMRDELRVVVATIAFGMGVDKGDVRTVIHYGPSRSIERYYQEAGRAGRDGRSSACTLLVSPGDWIRLERSGADVTMLESMRRYASKCACLQNTFALYFGEKGGVACGTCDACVDKLERQERKQRKRGSEDDGASRKGVAQNAAARSKVYRDTLSSHGAVKKMVKSAPFFGRRSIVSALKGKADTNAKLQKHPSFGILRKLSDAVILRLLEEMVLVGELRTERRQLSSGAWYDAIVAASDSDEEGQGGETNDSDDGVRFF